jgi:hypothetical protein
MSIFTNNELHYLHNVSQTRKWRDTKRHPRVAFVVDDLLPPWQARAVAMEAEAEL